jgi:hypothetical protein
VSDWTPSVFLDKGSDEPVYLQIGLALLREIHRGRFHPGDAVRAARLPSRYRGGVQTSAFPLMWNVGEKRTALWDRARCLRAGTGISRSGRT